MNTLRAARKQTRLRDARSRALRNVQDKEAVLERFAANDESGRPYRRPSGLSYQLKKAYGDYEHSLEYYDKADIALEAWLCRTQDELRRYLYELGVGVPSMLPSVIQLRPDGSTHIYYGTTGMPSDPGHGHINVNPAGTLVYLRTPGSRRTQKVGDAALVG